MNTQVNEQVNEDRQQFIWDMIEIMGAGWEKIYGQAWDAADGNYAAAYKAIVAKDKASRVARYEDED